MGAPETQFDTVVVRDANEFAGLPAGLREEYSVLASLDWARGHRAALQYEDLERTRKFDNYLGDLCTTGTVEYGDLMVDTIRSIRGGDVFVMATSPGANDRQNLDAVARGRLYTPGYQLRIAGRYLLGRPYVYIPDALGYSPAALDTAITGVAATLKATDKPVVVDTHLHNTENQEMLREIGFTNAGIKRYKSNPSLAAFIGSKYLVHQFRRKARH